MPNPEELARQEIDALLGPCGWTVQDKNAVNLQRWLTERRVGGAYGGMNFKTLKQRASPIPPIAEQQRIVAEVERRLSVIEELETVVNANLQRAARLRQSILHRAFSGKLVCDSN